MTGARVIKELTTSTTAGSTCDDMQSEQGELSKHHYSKAAKQIFQINVPPPQPAAPTAPQPAAPL